MFVPHHNYYKEIHLEGYLKYSRYKQNMRTVTLLSFWWFLTHLGSPHNMPWETHTGGMDVQLALFIVHLGRTLCPGRLTSSRKPLYLGRPTAVLDRYGQETISLPPRVRIADHLDRNKSLYRLYYLGLWHLEDWHSAKSWVSNPRPTSLYYAASATSVNCVYSDNNTIM